MTAATAVSSQRQIRFLRKLLGKALYEERRDHLTGLPGRKAALEALTRQQPGMAGLLDLDGFTQVNDRHGHPAGQPGYLRGDPR